MTIANFYRLIVAALSALLASCGGSSRLDLSVVPSALSYSQKSTFTISGADLAKVDKVTIKKCSGLTLESTSNAEQKVITCTINATGDLLVELKDTESAVLYSKTFTVAQPQVKMTTSLGDLVVELAPAQSPITVMNFLGYVNSGFYTNTLIHRVVPGFVAQGGMLNTVPAAQTGLRDPIALESNNGLINIRGSIGMARKAEANSATSQFYFNLADSTGLNYVSATQPGYAVFGKVVQGLDVMDAIGSVATGSKYGLNDYPLTDVVVFSVRQIQ